MCIEQKKTEKEIIETVPDYAEKDEPVRAAIRTNGHFHRADPQA